MSENKPEKEERHVGNSRCGNGSGGLSGLMSGDRVVTAGVFELDKLDEEVLAKTKLEIAPPKEEEEEEDEQSRAIMKSTNKCGSPLLETEGWPRHQIVRRRGRGGHSGLTAPSALSKVASQLFLDAQPPLLQEGTTVGFPSSGFERFLCHLKIPRITGLPGTRSPSSS